MVCSEVSKIKLYIVYIFAVVCLLLNIQYIYNTRAHTMLECSHIEITHNMCVCVCEFSTLRHVCFPIGF